MVPISGYSTLQDYSHLPSDAVIKLASCTRSATHTPTGSVRLCSLCLKDYCSEPNTTMIQHLHTHAPHLSDRDTSPRIIIEPKFSSSNQMREFQRSSVVASKHIVQVSARIGAQYQLLTNNKWSMNLRSVDEVIGTLDD